MYCYGSTAITNTLLSVLGSTLDVSSRSPRLKGWHTLHWARYPLLLLYIYVCQVTLVPAQPTRRFGPLSGLVSIMPHMNIPSKACNSESPVLIHLWCNKQEYSIDNSKTATVLSGCNCKDFVIIIIQFVSIAFLQVFDTFLKTSLQK